VRLDQHVPPFVSSLPMLRSPTPGSRLGDAARVGAPHEREVHQLLGLAAHRGAHVEEERQRVLTALLALARVDARQRGAPDAAQETEVLGAGEHAGARVARRDEGLGPPSATARTPTSSEASRRLIASRGSSAMPIASDAWRMAMCSGL